MAGGAHGWILALQPGRVEPRPMRIEPTAAQGRVALEALRLGMTGNATLEILTGRLAVAQQEAVAAVMETGSSQATTAHDS